jgi:hypothetical protein
MTMGVCTFGKLADFLLFPRLTLTHRSGESPRVEAQ